MGSELTFLLTDQNPQYGNFVRHYL